VIVIEVLGSTISTAMSAGLLSNFSVGIGEW
jgi:hypothetical protein